MSDYSMEMSQAEISSLKETLCAQQQLLQKLYYELDAEREASATAASETLSVILRLQGEKAAVKMEAEQYKRLAEEKMCYAEESLAIIEDHIYHKEMEVASLDYQVQAYRYKLLSMGCVDPGAGEIKFPENLFQRNEISASLPLKYKNCINKRERSTSPDIDLSPKIIEEHSGQSKNDQASGSGKKTDHCTHGDINSYWEQIKKLDVRVKEIASCSYTNFNNGIRSPSSLSSQPSVGNLSDVYCSANLRNETRSPSPQLDNCNPFDPNISSISINGINLTKHPVDSSANSVTADNSCPQADNSCPFRVHDVFEVPEIHQNCRSFELLTKDNKTTDFQGSKSPEIEDCIHVEAVEMFARNEPDWLKKLVQATHHENKFCKPRDTAPMDCHLAVVQPGTSVSEKQPRFKQLYQLSDVEVERSAGSTNKVEELKLLKEIKEQLNLLQDEFRSWTIKESIRHKPPLGLLSEAMLFFWL